MHDEDRFTERETETDKPVYWELSADIKYPDFQSLLFCFFPHTNSQALSRFLYFLFSKSKEWTI